MSLSTSLAEARQLYTLLRDIENELEVTEAKANTAKLAYADVYNVVQDVFLILRNMGLPEDAVKAISILQRLIAVSNTLLVTLTAVNIASGPMGWAIMGLGVGSTLISLAGSVG